MKIKPAEGRSVIDPVTKTLLSPDGEEKPETEFWLRRLRDGDVVPVDPPKAAKGKGE